MHQKRWKTYKLEKVATLQRGFDLPKYKRSEGNYPVIAASEFSTWHNEFKVKRTWSNNWSFRNIRTGSF